MIDALLNYSPWTFELKYLVKLTKFSKHCSATPFTTSPCFDTFSTITSWTKSTHRITQIIQPDFSRLLRFLFYKNKPIWYRYFGYWPITIEYFCGKNKSSKRENSCCRITKIIIFNKYCEKSTILWDKYCTIRSLTFSRKLMTAVPPQATAARDSRLAHFTLNEKFPFFVIFIGLHFC